MNGTYAALMAAAITAGYALFRGARELRALAWWEKAGLALGAFCGGMIGAKLPFVLADWQGLLTGTAWFDDGKTIMSGLVGGYLGVQLAEWSLGIRVSLGDSLAVPLAASVGIGRLACFSAGCCYGTATSLPWGVDFGDGVFRHPTQLYESGFHLLAAAVLFGLRRRERWEGRLLQYYFVAYCIYRFATEFIRPEPALWLGLTGYQWASLALIPFFALWSCPACRPPAVRRRHVLRPAEHPHDGTEHWLHDTQTLCPVCLRPVPGTCYEQNGKVYLRRSCPEHGPCVALVSADRRWYWLRDEVPHPPPERRCCCAGPGHRTCVALLEITANCNLHCPVCFAGTEDGGHRPLAALSADLDQFLTARGPLDVLQLSGGEPLLHPDLLGIIDRCHQLPIGHVMINTNGLELVRRDGLAAELARRRPRLELFLQLDGLDAASQRTLRGIDLLAEKQAVLETIIAHELPTTLVCTVVKGVNEAQVGPLLRLGLATRAVRGITYQPATFNGRFNCPVDPLERLTLADVVALLIAQSEGLFTADDFQPLPCSNPNCCGFTFALRAPGRPVLPLTRAIRYERHLARLADRMNFHLDDARACLGQAGRADDFFRVVIKPFMDAYTYDRERIEECCVHLIQPGGRAVSFCHFNTLVRNGTHAEPDVDLVELSRGC